MHLSYGNEPQRGLSEPKTPMCKPRRAKAREMPTGVRCRTVPRASKNISILHEVGGAYLDTWYRERSAGTAVTR